MRILADFNVVIEVLDLIIHDSMISTRHQTLITTSYPTYPQLHPKLYLSISLTGAMDNIHLYMVHAHY